MDKKYVIAVAIVVLGTTFYGGMRYGKSQTASLVGARGMKFQQMAGVGMKDFSNAGARGDVISGEILSRDEKSLTVKLKDGGSKIVFLSGTTEVTKTVDGAVDDLSAGKQVMISGSTNPDGSAIARTVQIRPEAPKLPEVK